MNCLISAQNYIRNGFNVLPLALNGTKKPICRWKPYQCRFASDHELQEWFSTDQCGIGVVAGAISGNLHVIDFDHEASEHFARFWNDAQLQLPGIIEKLIVIATPRPGRQIWFRQQSTPRGSEPLAYTEPQPVLADDGSPILADDGQPIRQPRVLIETRGTGGYACAVGTPLQTHRTGKPYQLLHGSFDRLPMLTDEEAETLLAICRGYTRFMPDRPSRPSDSRYTGEPRPGDIFNQHADLRQMLLEAGWTTHHTSSDGTEYLTRPGTKETPGYSASLGHIRSNDDRPLMYVFSTSAAPFQAQHCYDAFACFALLKHGGDFERAAAAARIQYAEQLAAAQMLYHAQLAKHVPDAKPYRPFPVHLLPEQLQQYVTEHADSIGIDSAFIAVPLLPVLAALIGQSRGLYLKRTFKLPSILWAVTIADVSSGKSPGWEAATAPAIAIENTLHRTMQLRDQQYKQQLQEWEAAKAAGSKGALKPIKERHSEQFMVNDATMEVLIDIHQANSSLLLSCDELAAWLRGMDQYRSGKGRDVENWLSIYNGGSMSVNRKTDLYRVYLRKTCISVCGTIQPGVANETLFTERFIENGFAARILSAQPPSSIVRWSEIEVPQATDDAINHLAQQLYRLRGEPCGDGTRTLYLPCSADAKQQFVQWMNDAADHAETLQSELRAAWLKLRPTAGRFALVLSVVKQMLHHPDGQATQPVDVESMRAGIELARWFGSELERNYGTDAETQLQQHLQWIRGKHPQGLDARTLYTNRRSIKTADDARLVMQQLIDRNAGTLDGLRFIPNP